MSIKYILDFSRADDIFKVLRKFLCVYIHIQFNKNKDQHIISWRIETVLETS